MSVRLSCLGVFIALMAAIGHAPTRRVTPGSQAPRFSRPSPPIRNDAALRDSLTQEAMREAELIAQMRSPDRAKRSAAIAELGGMNAQLLSDLKFPSLREHALRVLIEVGLENVVPAATLAEIASTGSASARRDASSVLSRKSPNILRPEIEAAMRQAAPSPQLAGAGQPGTGTRRRKIMTERYLELGGDVPPTLDPFREPPFGRLPQGNDNHLTVPQLLERMKDRNPTIRRSACAALAAKDADLRQSASQAALVLAALAIATHDDEEAVRYQAVAALTDVGRALVNWKSGELDPRVVPYLITAIGDRSGPVREAAVLAFTNFKRPSELLDRALLRSLDDPELRNLALLALASRGRTDQPSTESLLKIAMPGAGAAGECATKLLEPRLLAGQLTTEELGRLAARGRPEIQRLAVARLWADDPKLESFYSSYIMQQLASDARAMQILADSKAAVALLCEMVASGHGGRAIFEQVAAQKAAVPGLASALDRSNPRVRELAAEALGKLGPAAKRAVPALARHLADENGIVRLVSAYALEKIGPEARDALPALHKAAEGDDLALRSAAAHALPKIAQAAGSK